MKKFENMAKFKRKTMVFGAIGVAGAVLAVGLLVWLIISLNSNSTAPDTHQTIVGVESKSSTIMHVWIKTTNASSKARLFSSQQFTFGQESSRTNILETSLIIEFEFHEIKKFGSASFWWFDNETVVSYMYVYEPDEVLEKGIRIAYISPEAQIPYVPEGYHFRPPLGWMNDPNGFSKVGDTYHLFYQHYPHRPQWHSMHWGHATSKDLVNWVHMPIFLRPNSSLALEHGGAGGAYSGSAIPLGRTGIQIFHTDDIHDKEPQKEEQYTGISSDGVQLNLGSHVRLSIQQPKGYNLTTDFRDPAIFVGANGDYEMVLGSRANESGVILRYKTTNRNDIRSWEFQDIMWLDNRLGMNVAECPGVLPVGGGPEDESTLWALIYAQMNGHDPRTGKTNLTPVIVGEFRSSYGFVKRFEKPELDFGTHAYAFQGFYGPDGTIIIGWLANADDWDRKSDFPTAMTLPRKMILSKDRTKILTPPVGQVISLRNEEVETENFVLGNPITYPNGTAEVILTIQKDHTMILSLEIVYLNYTAKVSMSAEGLEIIPGPRVGPEPRLIALGAQPTKVRIFVDIGSIEVFGDNGEWAGTARIAGTEKFSSLRLTGDLDAVVSARVWSLKPAHMLGRYVP